MIRHTVYFLLMLGLGPFARLSAQISAISQSDIQPNSFRIAWQTAVPANAVVRYGASPDMPEKLLVPDLATLHSVPLSGLKAGTIYWVQVSAIAGQDTQHTAVQAFATRSFSSGQIKVYFNQGIDPGAANGLEPDGDTYQDVLAETIARIQAAQQTIDVAMYNNNRTDITDALREAHARGVRVRYIAAASTANTALSPAPPFPVLYGNDNGLMHHKFMAIDAALADKAWVMGGSLNWTSSNMTQDYNNTLFIQDQSLARTYELEFNEMWGTAGPQPNLANSRFGAAKQDNTPHHFVINGAEVFCWFSPSDHNTQNIVDALRTADHQLSFAIFSFTKNEIGTAISDEFAAGVWVRGIMENIDDPGAEIGWLTSQGVPVSAHPPGSLMHHKYAVMDAGYPDSDPLVLTGSHNWTNAAEFYNDENLLALHDPRLAILYQAEFARRWSELATPVHETRPVQAELFPNPATDRLTLRFPDANPWSGGEVALLDAAGRRYRVETTPAAGQLNLVFPDLPAGVYFIYLISANGAITLPFQTLPR